MNDFSSESILHLHAIVTGSVQGVGFRVTAQQCAKQEGIGGSVKNLSDGSVEIHAYGSKSQLEAFLELLQHKHLSRIDHISTKYSYYHGSIEDFLIP